MNFQINFQNAKRNFMTLTFDDERVKKVNGEAVIGKDGSPEVEQFDHKIMVGMPKKRIFKMLMDLKKTLHLKEEPQDEEEKTEHEEEMIDSIYLLVSAILSNNMAGEMITVDWVDDHMTIDDMKLFLTEYVKFCKGEASNPN